MIGDRHEAAAVRSTLEREPAVAVQPADLELDARGTPVGQPWVPSALFVESAFDGDGPDLPDFPLLALVVQEFAVRHGEWRIVKVAGQRIATARSSAGDGRLACVHEARRASASETQLSNHRGTAGT